MNIKNRKVYDGIVLSIMYLVLFAAFYLFEDHYLFGWLIHNKYYYFSLLAMSLIMLFAGADKLAFMTFLGNFAGVTAGFVLSEYLLSKNMEKISSGMPEEIRFRLSSPKHVLIWFGFVLLFIIVGIIIEIKRKNKK